ncbi:MAG: ACP S-malonyltransferase [bacterium]|nr:ACP S-malonyltransferase [bacterium]
MTKKIAFMFPGQGAQYVGMGLELHDKYELARELFYQANATLGYDLTKVMFEGPIETLTQTQYTQPAVFTLSVVASLLLAGQGIKPQIVAGHSLGEYAAMVASGILTFETGLKLVQIRGQLLQESAAKHPGTMAAIIGLDDDKVKSICENIKPGIVEPVNYNCPGQLVIAGETAAVQAAMAEAQKAGAMKVVQLQVSGPFHSSLMKEAGVQLETELGAFKLHDPVVPIIANYHAKFIQHAAAAKEAMVKQVYSPVLWKESMGLLIDNSAEYFVEIGPGKTLCGLLKRINRKTPCSNVENEGTLQELLTKIKI